MMFAVIVASKYEKPINTAEDLLKSGKPYFYAFFIILESDPSLALSLNYEKYENELRDGVK